MTCSRCGEACKGRLCRDCERMEHQESYYGVPSDNYDDDDTWSDEEGQTTLECDEE